MESRGLSLRITDRFGNSQEFENSGQLRRFVSSEREEWSWLAGSQSRPPNAQLQRQFISQFQSLLSWIDQFEAGNMDEAQLRNHFSSIYEANTPSLVFSEFPPGANISLIRDTAGADMASSALMFLTGKRAPNLADLDDFRAWQLLANPSLIKADTWLEDQKRRIASARQALRREIDKYSETTAELQRDTTATNREQRQRYRRVAALAVRWAKRRADSVEERAEKQLTLIQDTRLAYAEQMRLRAPVEYWSNKNKAHRDVARKWGLALAAYLTATVFAMWWGMGQVWSAIDPGEALSGRHFLLVASVGALLTLLFWMARLIVRIYLGERHLATDAEERRVMTQAYLALIKESAASDQERVVILSALFRTAQDGIVKEDGAGDISLPAMIARLLEAKR